MKENEFEVATNRLNDLAVQLWLRCIERENFRAIASDFDARGINAFGNNPRTHIIPEHDHASGASQGPAVQSFPNARKKAGFDNRAAQSHVRVHITNVVDIGLAL